MSIADRGLEALKAAVRLASRVTALADSVADLAREVPDIDRRLVRVETMIEVAARGGFSGRGPGAPPAIEDRR
jgi:hypothetical protein